VDEDVRQPVSDDVETRIQEQLALERPAQPDAVAVGDQHGRQERVGQARVAHEEQERPAADGAVAPDLEAQGEEPLRSAGEPPRPAVLQPVVPAEHALAAPGGPEAKDEARREPERLAAEVGDGEEHQARRRQPPVAYGVEDQRDRQQHRQQRQRHREAEDVPGDDEDAPAPARGPRLG